MYCDDADIVDFDFVIVISNTNIAVSDIVAIDANVNVDVISCYL